MAEKKESGEDILRAILEKGGARVKEQVAQELAKKENTPEEPTPAAKEPAKKRRRSLKDVAGSFGKTKYYYAPDGTVVDEDGQPAPKVFAELFAQKEKMVEKVKENIVPKSLRVVEGEINKGIIRTSRLSKIHDSIYAKTPIVLGEFDKTIQNLTQQHENIVRQLIQQNQDLQDKVIEMLTGQKAPTRSAGAVAPKRPAKGSMRATGGSRAAKITPVQAAYQKARVTKPKQVKARQEAMLKAREEKTQSMVTAAGLVAAGIGAAGAILSNMGGQPSAVPGGGATPPAGGMWPNTQSSGDNKQILETIKKRESGGNYNIRSNSSSASGAYQFIDSTWRGRAQKAGVDIQQYPRAYMAPPEIQDKVADVYISEILRQNNNDVSKIPLVWYTGNAAGQMSANALAVNRGLTPQAYQASWMKTYEQMGGNVQTASAQQTTPRAPGAPQQANTNASVSTTPAPGAPQNPGNISAPGAAAPSGSAPGQPQQTGSLPSGDIVGAGKWLQGQGIRVSEHPAFGGVAPVHKGKSHYEGRSIDVNAGTGIVEANDPVWGPRFDELANKARSAGYTVIWRSAGHYNHMHIETPRGNDNQQNPGNIAAPGAAPPSGSAPGNVAAAVSGTPTRRASITPVEAEQHKSNMSELQNLNDLLKRKGPDARLGETNEARRQELETSIKSFNQKFSLSPIQEAGLVRPMPSTMPQAAPPPPNAPSMMPQRPANPGIAFNQASRGMNIEQEMMQQMQNILPIIMNNTQYVNNTRIINRGQSFVSRPSDGFDPLSTVAAAAGFAIGKGLRGLF
jgi:hypothetical protein